MPILTTVNPIYEYSDEINAAAEHDFAERQAKLWEVCAKYNFERTPNAWEFFISPGHNLAWCNVFKAGSSTWIYYFNILGACFCRYCRLKFDFSFPVFLKLGTTLHIFNVPNQHH